MSTKKATLSKFEKSLLVSSKIKVKANSSLAELIKANVLYLRTIGFNDEYLNDEDLNEDG